jgi:hypothetical protein
MFNIVRRKNMQALASWFLYDVLQWLEITHKPHASVA